MRLAIIIFFFFTPTLFGVGENNSSDSSRELKLGDYQFETIAEDLPSCCLVFDQNNTLWIAGKKSLWIWNTLEKRLQQMNLLGQNKKENLALKHLEIRDKWIFAASDTALFQIDTQQMKAFRYDLFHDSFASHGIYFDDDLAFWVRSNGVYVIRPNLKSLVRLTTHQIPKDAMTMYYHKENLLWSVEKNNIKLINYNKTPAIEHQIMLGKNNFLDIKSQGSDVYIYNKYTVLRFDIKGDILQTIPVEGDNRLILMSLDEQTHYYLLSNSSLELYFLNSKTSKIYDFDLGRVKKAFQMARNNSMIGMILDGNPRLFQLSGKW